MAKHFNHAHGSRLSPMNLSAVVASFTLLLTAKGGRSSPATQHQSVDEKNNWLGVSALSSMQERGPAELMPFCNIMTGDEKCEKACKPKHPGGHCEDSQFPIRPRPQCVCKDPCSFEQFEHARSACRTSCTDIMKAMTGRCMPLNAGVHSKCHCRAMHQKLYVPLEEARQSFGPNAWQYKKKPPATISSHTSHRPS